MLAAPLFESGKELMGYYIPFIGVLSITQLGLAICILFVLRKNCINDIIGSISSRLSTLSKVTRYGVLWLLLSIIVSPYLSFIGTSLFLYGYVVIFLFGIIYTILLCIRKVREVCIRKNCFYYLMHLSVQQLIGYCIYITIYEVRFWEMYSFPKNEEQFWLGEIYPELGVLRRCCDDFVVILCLMVIPYIIIGIYYCVKCLVGKLELNVKKQTP